MLMLMLMLRLLRSDCTTFCWCKLHLLLSIQLPEKACVWRHKGVIIAREINKKKANFWQAFRSWNRRFSTYSQILKYWVWSMFALQIVYPTIKVLILFQLQYTDTETKNLQVCWKCKHYAVHLTRFLGLKSFHAPILYPQQRSFWRVFKCAVTYSASIFRVIVWPAIRRLRILDRLCFALRHAHHLKMKK